MSLNSCPVSEIIQQILDGQREIPEPTGGDIEDKRFNFAKAVFAYARKNKAFDVDGHFRIYDFIGCLELLQAYDFGYRRTQRETAA